MKKYIKPLILTLAAASASCLLAACPREKSNVDYVNMHIGTDGANKTEYGGTTPAVGAPFAMTQWGASTRRNKISRTIYHASDDSIIGFIATHQPAIWMGDYAFLTIMPQLDTPVFNVQKRAAKFDKPSEKSTPYFYEVSYGSEKKKITVRLTATSRCGVFGISYPEGGKPVLVIEASRGIDGGGGVEIDPEKRQIRVFNTERQDAHLGPELKNLAGYYVMDFDSPFVKFGVSNGESLFDKKTLSATKAEKKSVYAYVEFPATARNVEVRIGSSFIDYAQAKANMAREIKGKTFDRIANNVRTMWSEYLDKIEIDASEDDKVMFYTSFFRTLQYPREFSEYGRYYSAFDDKIHNGVSYNAYSMWDTFRAEHPWLQIVAPERVDDMMTALVQMFDECGWIPKWPNPSFTNIMIGTHADAIIADAYINGFRKFDARKAYQALLKDAKTPPRNDTKKRWGDRDLWDSDGYEARGGLTYYLKNGYVANDITREAASRTLEFALDDFCVAQMAKALGNTADYAKFLAQSKNYKNIYNPATAFFHAKNLDGSFAKSPNDGFTEVSKWNYRFCVMQDPHGLVELMGGNENYIKNLDEVFDGNHYSHDNEPAHHYAYMYNYANRLDKTQARIPDILRKNYKTATDGLSGNDDCGQMSAWYLFSSLGFYPVCPASGEYALGIPLFKSAKIRLANGKTLKILAPETGREKTLTNVSFDGKTLETPFIKVRDIFNGGTLEFKKAK